MSDVWVKFFSGKGTYHVWHNYLVDTGQTATNLMPSMTTWTPTHFPAAMRSLNPSTRAKAIELANQLIARGDVNRQEAVQISISEARRMARASYPSGNALFAYSPA